MRVGIVVCNLFPCHDFMGFQKGLENRFADQHCHVIVFIVTFAVKATCMVVSRDSRCWYLTMVNPNNAPRSIPSAAATCVARRVDRAERASESATQLHLPCMHVFESTLLLSSCCSCTHLAHDHIDHDLSYDYDVRQTDSPKHALSVTTPLYDDDPVGPPAIETPGSWTWIVDDQRVFQKEQQQKITSRIVQHRW